ncbi:toll/interleukin-1 receptor domain-containing protein [Methylomicrobium lacus]|uniref:toll/interleukin-1 receptor domain-containing protein n=1 Tax=Methylomicrobium lacus TaxID=136992 RepID=UPI0035A8432D
MTTVFLSYSTKDHHFAELIAIKLAEAGINVWRDQGNLSAGTDWRQGIERGIVDSIAVIVALSSNSAESSYVTFEWAYALGNGHNLIPIKLNDCVIHPRLQTIQHLDFSVPGALPWASLIERIREIEADAQQQNDPVISEVPSEPPVGDAVYVKAILAYLNQRGYQAISFERLRQRVDASLTDQRLNELIIGNPAVFRHAKLKAGPGLAKIQP